MLGALTQRYKRVYPVFIRQGLAWEEVELRALHLFLGAVQLSSIRSLTVLSLPMQDVYGKHWSTTGKRVPGANTRDEAVYLPGRNLMLLSKTTVFCSLHKVPVIALGSLGHNPFPDATPQFFREFATAAGRALNFKLRIIAPFRRLSKEQVIRRHCELPLHLSFSCLAPVRGQHCGRCNKCAERRQAFQRAGVADATSYAR